MQTGIYKRGVYRKFGSAGEDFRPFRDVEVQKKIDKSGKTIGTFFNTPIQPKNENTTDVYDSGMLRPLV